MLSLTLAFRFKKTIETYNSVSILKTEVCSDVVKDTFVSVARVFVVLVSSMYS